VVMKAIQIHSYSTSGYLSPNKGDFTMITAISSWDQKVISAFFEKLRLFCLSFSSKGSTIPTNEKWSSGLMPERAAFFFRTNFLL
jgi:hypothetical protein